MICRFLTSLNWRRVVSLTGASKYTLNGRKFKTHPSAAEAERASGIFATSIGKVASGEDISPEVLFGDGEKSPKWM
jgi:hypothetical protein